MFSAVIRLKLAPATTVHAKRESGSLRLLLFTLSRVQTKTTQEEATSLDFGWPSEVLFSACCCFAWLHT